MTKLTLTLYYVITILVSSLDQISSGAVESAKSILAELLRKCNSADVESTALRERYFSIVIQNMVREVVSPNHTVREQVCSPFSAGSIQLVLWNKVESKGNPDIEYIWTFSVFIDGPNHQLFLYAPSLFNS